MPSAPTGCRPGDDHDHDAGGTHWHLPVLVSPASSLCPPLPPSQSPASRASCPSDSDSGPSPSLRLRLRLGVTVVNRDRDRDGLPPAPLRLRGARLSRRPASA
eukprot:1460896-Rhodomonas_salina.3